MKRLILIVSLLAVLWSGYHLTGTAYDLTHGSLSYRDNVDYLVKYGFNENFSDWFCSLFVSES